MTGLILRLHPDDLHKLRNVDRLWLEGLGYTICPDPYGCEPGCAMIMDLRSSMTRYLASLRSETEHDCYN